MVMECMASVKSFNDILGNLDKPVNFNLEYDLMKEEVLEYFEGGQKEDEKEMQDALADEFVIWWGTVLKHGWADKVFKIIRAVCESNMTKFCETQEEAEESVTRYTAQGIPTRWEYNEKYKLYVIFNMSGKGMKGINYMPPQF